VGLTSRQGWRREERRESWQEHRNKKATDWDYKVCQEQRLAIEDVRDYEAHCAVNHRDVGHTRVIPLAKAPSLRPETGPLPLLREYAEPWLHAFGNVRLTGRKVQLKIKNEEGEVLAGLRLIGG
jgi:hypothetical protein